MKLFSIYTFNQYSFDQKQMYQIPRPTPQSLPKHLITEPPNSELSHCLPQPRLKHIRRSLLLCNDTNRRFTRVRTLRIRRSESTNLRAGAHERRNQRLVINTITRKNEIKALVFIDRIYALFFQQAGLISLPIERCERDVSHGGGLGLGF